VTFDARGLASSASKIRVINSEGEEKTIAVNLVGTASIE
jgi:hypothetical protein